MARRVQNVDAEAVIFKLEYGRGDRDAALLLDFHPVGNRMACIFLALDRAGELDRSAVQQEFLCNGSFTGIRMRDNRKRPAFFNFILISRQNGTSEILDR